MPNHGQAVSRVVRREGSRQRKEAGHVAGAGAAIWSGSRYLSFACASGAMVLQWNRFQTISTVGDHRRPAADLDGREGNGRWAILSTAFLNLVFRHAGPQTLEMWHAHLS
jgi:hypothetical protein